MKGYKSRNISVIGFLSIALVFSADTTDGGRDLIDSLVDYVDAQTEQTRGE